MLRESIYLVPYKDDPLALLAQHILSDYSQQLPDLTEVVVLLAEPHAARRLRHHLLQQAEQLGHYALLCPQVYRLRDWATLQFNKSRSDSFKVYSQHQRELILFDALTQHQELLGSGSPWHLTDDLLKLFDQLTANQHSLPEDYDSFEKQISGAYGISQENFASLGHEATLVHTLWKAWHTQLNAETAYDSEAAYLLGLKADLEHNQQTMYIAGYHQFSVTEQDWIKQRVKLQRCVVYLHGQVHSSEQDQFSYHPDTGLTNLLRDFNIEASVPAGDDYSRFINCCYSHQQQPFMQRATGLSDLCRENIQQRLKLYFAAGHEEQAHAVELQVRRWLLEGKKNIGIVTENRRLARRVRALLERADVELQDLAGWALSTTRAGAVLERWLECIEEDFSHQPLLDILKSPFIFSNKDTNQVKHASYRLEHDIIRHENIARNLSAYKKGIEYRAEKLEWTSEESEMLQEMLETFEAAYAILKPFLQGKHPANDFIEALTASLDIIGMTGLLQQDEAGSRVLDMLETLQHSASQYSLTFSWSDFRTWLGRSLEKFVFAPELANSIVTLMGLAQSRLQKFDALIIASAEQEHLPGKPDITPFFNNNVRQQLKLATNQDILSERFHHFRRLLEASPEILITANHEDNGEEVAISPWLEIIHRMYQQVYSETLEDNDLKSLAIQPGTFVIRCTEQSLPEKTQQAQSTLPADLVPKSYSPSSYQALLNCPYQFFISRGLELATSEEVQEALSKSDYGERVHRCLEAFHQNVDHLPGPFDEQLTEKNSEAAMRCLTEISQQVFKRDIEDNFEHSGWLSQWLKLIPDYINWQIKQSEQWKFYQAEHKSSIKWQHNTELHGRLDRLDKNETGLNVLDYKTGSYARQADIESGEAVQLPFYALLAEAELKQPVSQVAYLDLNNTVKTGTHINGDELDTISHKIGERLATLIEQMLSGKELTAWGDETTCEYCNINRVCRKQAWSN